MEENLRTADYLSADTAVAFHQFMRDNNFSCKKIRVLNMIYYFQKVKREFSRVPRNANRVEKSDYFEKTDARILN